MMAMTMAKAAAGDAEAIRDVNFLRSIGLIKDEPKVTPNSKWREIDIDQRPIWEIFDEIYADSRRTNRYRRRQH